MTDRLDEIQQRLDAYGTYPDGAGKWGEFFSHAPDDIRYLLADNKRLRKVVFEATSIHLNVKDASKIPIPLWMALTELAEKAEVALGNRPAPALQQGAD